MVTSNCKKCGKEIVKRGSVPAVFCSKACTDTRKPKPCARCGKEMLLPECLWERTTHCSRVCRRNRIKINCAGCGKEFEPQVSQYALGTRCCSLTCQRTHRVRSARTTPEPEPVSGCRWIPLTKGKFALVDEADHERVSAIPWQWCKGERKNKPDYALTRIYVEGGRCVSMHRYVMGEPTGFEVDHVNMDGLDNRRSNLRVATRNEQRANQCKPAGCASQYKGVSKTKVGTWAATIGSTSRGSGKRLGHFKTEEDAALAYDEAARLKYGEFARLNFPEPGEQAARRS